MSTLFYKRLKNLNPMIRKAVDFLPVVLFVGALLAIIYFDKVATYF